MSSNINVQSEGESVELPTMTVTPDDGSSGPPHNNILNQFASYNYIITITALSNEEINFPADSYRTKEPDSIVLKSGGAGKDKIKSIQEQNAGISTDLYVDELEIVTLFGANKHTKLSTAVSFNFKVIEPYSMGMFLEVLREAAVKKGFDNYVQAPFLLTIEFKGWTDHEEFVHLKDYTRHFPIHLINAQFTVDTTGSTYNVQGIAWNDQGFADETQSIKFDIDMEGKDISELLQTGYKSLATLLNGKEIESKEQGEKPFANEYVILFPTDRDILSGGGGSGGGSKDSTNYEEKITGTSDIPTNLSGDPESKMKENKAFEMQSGSIGDQFREYATSNINDIGKSIIEQTHLKKGIPFFGKAPFVEDENKKGTFKRDKIVISNNATRVEFKRGTRIQDIIEEVILLSEYGREFLAKDEDDKGMKEWFKIETNVFIGQSDDMCKTGDKPKIYVYKVIPYKLNISSIKSLASPTPGVDSLRKEVMKEYNYMYTGKNDSIIEFNIDINYAYITALQSDFGMYSDKNKIGTSADRVSNEGTDQPDKKIGESSDCTNEESPTAVSINKPNTGGTGGGSRNDSDSQMTRNIHDIITSGVDLIQLDLKIWGDPYFMSDSGVGNYTAEETKYINMTTDGTMDYQYSEVDIVVNFRTPIDIGDQGMMTFPSDDGSSTYKFSGLYRVWKITNTFSEGKFVQELKLIRRHKQDDNSSGNTEELVKDK